MATGSRNNGATRRKMAMQTCGASCWGDAQIQWRIFFRKLHTVLADLTNSPSTVSRVTFGRLYKRIFHHDLPRLVADVVMEILFKIKLYTQRQATSTEHACHPSDDCTNACATALFTLELDPHRGMTMKAGWTHLLPEHCCHRDGKCLDATKWVPKIKAVRVIGDFAILANHMLRSLAQGQLEVFR